MRVRDLPLRFASEREVLLLKALIAFGPESVATERLAQALYPEASASDALRAVDEGLDALRTALGEPAPIAERLGRVQLDPDASWIDVNAFVDAARSAQRGSLPLTLYQGRFLPETNGLGWLDPIRERLHTRYLRYVAELAGASERRDQWEEAIAVYELGLSVDDLHEPFYQGILRCQLVQGKHDEVMRTYERCEHRLSKARTARPSEHTQTLIRASFYAQAPATKRVRAS